MVPSGSLGRRVRMNQQAWAGANKLHSMAHVSAVEGALYDRWSPAALQTGWGTWTQGQQARRRGGAFRFRWRQIPQRTPVIEMYFDLNINAVLGLAKQGAQVRPISTARIATVRGAPVSSGGHE